MCSVGPLDPDLKYVVVPSQDGYVFSEVEGKKGHFRAIKLGQVTVKVSLCEVNGCIITYAYFILIHEY